MRQEAVQSEIHIIVIGAELPTTRRFTMINYESLAKPEKQMLEWLSQQKIAKILTYSDLTVAERRFVFVLLGDIESRVPTKTFSLPAFIGSPDSFLKTISKSSGLLVAPPDMFVLNTNPFDDSSSITVGAQMASLLEALALAIPSDYGRLAARVEITDQGSFICYFEGKMLSKSIAKSGH